MSGVEEIRIQVDLDLDLIIHIFLRTAVDEKFTLNGTESNTEDGIQWSVPKIEQEFTDFSKFRETDKSPKHELGSV